MPGQTLPGIRRANESRWTSSTDPGYRAFEPGNVAGCGTSLAHKAQLPSKQAPTPRDDQYEAWPSVQPQGADPPLRPVGPRRATPGPL